MLRLEDIPKKQIFEVPQRYFEELPLRIQSSVAASHQRSAPKHVWRYAVQYALPLVVAGAVLFYYYHPAADAESILESVETADLVLYLQQEPALTADDIIENVDFVPADVEAIEAEAYDLEIGSSNSDLELELNTL
jgi:hypothetical protein